MKFFVKNNNVNNEESECVIVAIFKFNKLSNVASSLNDVSCGFITKLMQNGDISGDVGEVSLLYNIPNSLAERVVFVGCGEEKQITVLDYKKIITNSINILKKIKLTKIIFYLLELSVLNQDNYWKIRIAIETILNNYYFFQNFKNNAELKTSSLKHIIFHVDTKYDLSVGKVAIQHALAISEGLKAAKDLANMPPNVCNPMYLALKSRELSEKYQDKIITEIMDSKKIKQLGMSAYIAVGQGSVNDSYMSVIHYQGSKQRDQKPIVLIGKGVTFDSGGISIKSSYRMNEMKYDMSGAAAVYGVMLVAAKLKLALNIIGILACSENMPSGSAFRPGDVLTTMSGKTVEILDTDAEGRLLLCDVLTYVEKFNPELVIDIATLTGACVVALGNVASGLLSNNSKLIDDLIESGEQTDDKVWNLPLFPEFQEELNSKIADIKNIGGRSAGAITAACFLSRFTKKYRWAHLDIAGTAWNSNKLSGATGRPVSLISQFLLKKSLTNVYF